VSKLVKNTFIYTLGNALVPSMGFILLPLYAKYLTPADYGIVAAMATLSGVLAILYTLCAERAVYRLYYDYKSEADKKIFLGSVATFTIILSVAAAALLFIFSNAAGSLYKSIPFHPYYAYTIMTCLFLTFSYIPLINLRVTERAGEFVILSSGQFLLTTALIVFFVCVKREGAAGQLKATFLSALIAAPVYLYILGKIATPGINKRIIGETLRYSMPMVPSLLTAWVLNLSSRIFLERYFTLADVGVFSLAHKIGTLGLVIFGGFNAAYAPYFYKMANDATDILQSKNKLSRINDVYTVLALASIFFVALFTKEVMETFIDSRYSYAYGIARVVLYAYYFSALMSLAGLSITQSKKTKQDMYISLIVAVLNVMLNLALIPRFGINGAAAATILTFVCGYAIEYEYSKRCFFVQTGRFRLMTYIACSGAILTGYHFYLERWPLFAFISKLVLAAATAYGLLRMDEIRNILKLKKISA